MQASVKADEGFLEQDQITIQAASDARLARLSDAAARNPAFNLTPDGYRNSVVETAWYF